MKEVHEEGLQAILAVMAENGGPQPQAVMNATLANALALGLQAFYLIRASTMLTGVGGSATLAGVGSAFRAMTATP